MGHFVAETLDKAMLVGYFKLCQIDRGSGRQDDYIRAKVVIDGLQHRGYVFDYGEAVREAAKWVGV